MLLVAVLVVLAAEALQSGMLTATKLLLLPPQLKRMLDVHGRDKLQLNRFATTREIFAVVATRQAVACLNEFGLPLLNAKQCKRVPCGNSGCFGFKQRLRSWPRFRS